MAWGVYAAGVILCLGSLLRNAWVGFDEAPTMAAVLVECGEGLFTSDRAALMDIDQFVQVFLPSIGMVLSFVMLVPAALLLWLASRSRLFKWMGWVVWALVLLLGPVLVTRVLWVEVTLEGDPWEILGGGYWVWCVGVALPLVAFGVVGVRKNVGMTVERGAGGEGA